MKHRYFYFLLLVSALTTTSCGKLGSGILAKKTAREKYEERIEKAAPVKSAAWLNAGESALQNPLTVPVPYAEAGFLSGDKPDATAFYFSVKAGQKVTVDFKKATPTLATTFIELWEVKDNNERKLVASADTLLNLIEHADALPRNYILRMQPQLGARGSYTLNILINPMFGFPIEDIASPKVASFWGAARDGGVRKHEGIDIFAKKGSKVLAVMDGVITNIKTTPIGGKVVWLRPYDQPFSVYYAHLDKQLVQEGQTVKRGDIIGTVGNTGNAQHTAAHLHFGVYSWAGAVDPINFVQKVNSPQQPVARNLNAWYKTSAKTMLYPSPERTKAYTVASATRLKTESFSNNFYRVQLENGTRGFVPSSELTDKMKL